MTKEATHLMAEALKRVTVSGSFDPAEVGKRVGLSKHQSQAAARVLSNAGVLVLGFDSAAEFSPDFRKANAKASPRARKPSRGGKK